MVKLYSVLSVCGKLIEQGDETKMSENGTDDVDTVASLSSWIPLEGKENTRLVAPSKIFRQLYGERWKIFAMSAAIFAGFTAVAFLLPPRFTSATSFIPPTLNNGSSMVSVVAGQLSALGTGDILWGMKSPGDLYAGILRSRSIGEELVRRFGLMDVYGVKTESRAEEKLAADTDINADIRSTIVTVEVTEKNPRFAHDLASAYIDALRETNGCLALGQSSQRRLFFGQQLSKEKADLEDAEVELKKT